MIERSIQLKEGAKAKIEDKPIVEREAKSKSNNKS